MGDYLKADLYRVRKWNQTDLVVFYFNKTQNSLLSQKKSEWSANRTFQAMVLDLTMLDNNVNHKLILHSCIADAARGPVQRIGFLAV